MTPLRDRLYYSAGGAVYATKEAAYNIFILLYYTQVLGLNGALTGTVIACGLAWDAISDPLVGTWSDRLKTRFGRRFPLLVASILPLGIGYLGLFTPPAFILDDSLLLAGWLLFWSLWVRTFITSYAIPHLALATEISTDSMERSRLLGWRMAVLFLTAVLLPASALLLIFGGDADLDGRFIKANYPIYGVYSCLVCWLCASVSVFGLRRFARDDGVPDSELAAHHPDRPRLVTLTADLFRTFRNRNFRYLVGYDMAVMVSFGVVSTLNMLVWTYYWEFSSVQISVILSVPSLLAVALLLVSLDALGRHFSQERLLELAALGLLGNSLWLYPAHVAGWLPEQNQWLMFSLNFLLMLFFMYCFLVRAIFTQSLTAAISDVHAKQHRLRQEGGFFAAGNFTQKIATVFGPFYGGLALDVIGLEPNALPGSVNQSVLDQLVYAYGLGFIPAVVLSLFLARQIHRKS